MFFGREIPMEKMTTATSMENLFVQIFERKRRIVEQVKQQMDLYDQQLASKCLLDGVTPPPWLWSPSFPSQTSELNKEEIISGLLFPHSRPSNIYSSSRRFSYQQPVSLSANNGQTLEPNQPLEKQLVEDEPLQDLSFRNLEDGGSVSYSANEQFANISPARESQEEGILENASTCCKQNISCLFPEHSQIKRVEKSVASTSIDATSSGYSQGKKVPKVISVSHEQEPDTSSIYHQDGAAPDTCPDPVQSLARIHRSKSRQRALEVRSSAKASKIRSKGNSDLQASPAENLNFEIASLRSDNVDGIELFKNDDTDKKGHREDAVENSSYQGKERDQDIEFSATPKSSSPHEKVESVRLSSSLDQYDSVAPDSGDRSSLLENSLVKKEALSQPLNTTNGVSAKEEEIAMDSQSKGCSEKNDFNTVTRSKSLTKAFSCKNEDTDLISSCVGEHPSRSSNASPRMGGIDQAQSTSMNSEASVEIDTNMDNSQPQNVYSGRVTRPRSAAQGCRSKNVSSDNVDSSSVKLQSGYSAALLQCGDERTLLPPIAVRVEGSSVEEDGADDKQYKEKGGSIDISTISRSKSLHQADILVDEPTKGDQIQDCSRPMAEMGYIESSSVELQLSHSVTVLQYDDETELLKPTTVREQVSSVEEDYTGDIQCKGKGESSQRSGTLTSRDLSQAEASLDEPAVVGESALQEKSFAPGDLAEHSKRRDLSCGTKVVQTIVESSHHSGTISRREGLAEERGAPSIISEHDLVAKKLDVDSVSISSSSPHNIPESLKLEPLHFDDCEDQTCNGMQIKCGEESTKVDPPTTPPVGKEVDVPSPTDPRANLLEDNRLSAIEDHDGQDSEQIQVRESSIGDTDFRAEESEPGEANIGLSVDIPSNVHLDVMANGLKRSFASSVPTNLSGDSVGLQAPGESSLSKISKEPILYCLSDLSGNKESKVSIVEDICQLDELDHAISTSNKRSDEREMMDNLSEVECNKSSNSYLRSAKPENYSAALDNGFSDDALQQQMTQSPHQVETSFGKGHPHSDRNIACEESSHIPPLLSSIQVASCSSPLMESSHLQIKRRKTLDQLIEGMPLSVSQEDDVLDSSSVRQTHAKADHSVESHNLNHYDVEMQKMLGSASSTELRFDEDYLLKTAGFKSPATLTINADHLSSRAPLDGSLPVLERFIIQTDDENEIGSRDEMNLDSLQLPKTTVERASVLEQICWSACMSTPSLHLSTSSSFNQKLKLNQSVQNQLLTDDDETKKHEDSSLMASLGTENTIQGSSQFSQLSFSGAGSFTDDMKPCSSPKGRLWYRSMQKSASSEKRGSQSPDLPCISEENENTEEEMAELCSRKRESSSPDLPIIAEENENTDEMKNASAERNPLDGLDENIERSASVSKAKMHVDRQSLESVNNAFSFTATRSSAKGKMGKQKGGKRRCTGKGKENLGISCGSTAAARNIDLRSKRFSKPKLSTNSSLSEKEHRHNNIVSNITSFIPLVQQPKPVSELITGKRDVKVKALEAAEAAKRLAEKKEKERKMKKEALILERAKQEQEILRKQELDKQKREERRRKEADMVERKRQKEEEEKKLKEEERKRKEAEMAERKRAREEEERVKEEERKRKEAEMAERKRQREEEENKVKEERKRKEAEMAERKRQKGEEEKRMKEEERKRKEAEIAERKRQREEEEKRVKEEERKKKEAEMAERKRQGEEEEKKVREAKRKRVAEANIAAEKGEKAMATRIPKIPESESKSVNSPEHDSKVTSDPNESYDISPYKCSDDEDDEDEDDDVPNSKYIPSWASKDCVLEAVSFQQNIAAEKIFPRESFCSIGEILLPRRLKPS